MPEFRVHVSKPVEYSWKLFAVLTTTFFLKAPTARSTFCGHPRFSHSTDPLDLSSQFTTGEAPRPPVTVSLAQRRILEQRKALVKLEKTDVKSTTVYPFIFLFIRSTGEIQII